MVECIELADAPSGKVLYPVLSAEDNVLLEDLSFHSDSLKEVV